MISRISVEIEYINLPVFEIIKKLESSESCCSLDFISFCLKARENGNSFYECWKKGISQSSLPFKKEERDKLISLGSMIGTSDSEGQRAMLALYGDYFSSFREKAAEQYEKHGKMCITLSGIIGTGIFILLM